MFELKLDKSEKKQKNLKQTERQKLISGMISKSERTNFNGREDEFVFFTEQFEARVQSLKLGNVLNGDATPEDYMLTVRNGSSEKKHKL